MVKVLSSGGTWGWVLLPNCSLILEKCHRAGRCMKKKIGRSAQEVFFIGSISLEQITEFGVQSLTQR